MQPYKQGTQALGTREMAHHSASPSVLELGGAGRAIAERVIRLPMRTAVAGVRRPWRTSSYCRSAPRLSTGAVKVVGSSLDRTQTSERSVPAGCSSTCGSWRTGRSLTGRSAQRWYS